MSGEQTFVKSGDYEKNRKKSADEFIEFMEICLDEGWSPTKCPAGCPVEPDGICPHGFKSIVLELGFIVDGRIDRLAIQNYGSNYSRQTT
ncbi:MAG TPA: hypothetical protein PKY82_15100 [Pyrinomonadaceae bacterium]|nr:hypothetical protein [Pyrinomonadaceae bacterium]